MLQYEQNGSAIDLITRLFDVLDLQELSFDERKRMVLLLFEKFPLDHSSCDQYVRMVLKWSTKYCSDPNGDPAIHHFFGAGYLKDGQYYNAESHFINGTEDSAKLLGFMEFELSLQQLHPDPGYFLLRGVLPLLFKSIDYARICFDEFVARYKQKYEFVENEGVILSPNHHLFNYAQTILILIEKNDGQQFTSLANEFQQYLSTDSYLLEVFKIH
jgi:hypothetical protein